jgi:hypothetical protein
MIGGKQTFAEPSLAMMLGVATVAVLLVRLEREGTPVALRTIAIWIIAGMVVVASAAGSGASSPAFLSALLQEHDWRAAASLLLVLVGSLLVLGWGFRVGAAEIAQEGVAQSLARSSGTVLVLFLLTLSFPVVRSQEMLVPVLLIFLSGALGLALANFARVRPGAGKGLASLGLDRYWTQTVSAVVALLVLTGFALTGWVGTQGFAEVITFALVLLAAVFTGLSWVIVAFGVVVFFLIFPLFQYLGRLFGPLALPTSMPMPSAPAPVPGAARAPVNPVMVNIFEVGGYLLAISILAALVLAVFLLRRRVQFSQSSEEEETRESVFSADLLRRQVRRLLGRWPHSKEAIPPPFSELAWTSDTRIRIRLAYRRLLSWAAEHGRPRQPEETPLRYRQALLKEFPGQRNEITGLTDLYTPARYGREQPPAEEARRAEDLSRLLGNEGGRLPPRNPPAQEE